MLDQRTFRLTRSELERTSCRWPAGGAAGAADQQRVNGFEVDFFWPDLGLVVETDGLRYHRTPAEQARDRLRDQAHTAAGLTPLRFTHEQVRYEVARRRALRTVARRLGAALVAGRRCLSFGSMTELPSSVRIREVGPRDGFQNEPETISTADKVRLIDLLSATGLTRIEVTSFVRPDVIPQLADAAEVLAAVQRRDGRRLLGPDPERARARAGAGAARALRRGQRLPLRLGDPQPQERQPLDRGVAGRAGGGRSPTPARPGCAARA